MFFELAKQYLDEKLKNGSYNISPTEETAIACFAEWLNENAAQQKRVPDALYCTSCGDEILPICSECAHED